MLAPVDDNRNPHRPEVPAEPVEFRDRRPRDPDDETVDVAPYLRALLRRRWWLLGAALGGAIAAFAWASARPAQYRSVATLMVVHSKLANPATRAFDDLVTEKASYRALLENRTVASDVLRALGVDKPPHSLSATVLLERHVSVEDVPKSSLLRMRVTFGDPSMATNIANSMARRGVEVSRQISVQESVVVREQLREQRDEARRSLDEAQRLYLAHRTAARWDDRKRRVDAALEQRASLVRLATEVQRERARVLAAEREIAQRRPVMTVNRSLVDDPILLDVNRDRAGDASQRLRTQIQSEVPNTAYLTLDQDAATARATLAGLEKQMSQIEGGTAVLKDLEDLYRVEVELGRLEAEFNLAKRIYEDVAARYEQARTLVTGSNASLQIVDEAMPADRAEPRGRLLAGVVGAAAALVVVASAVVLGELRRQL